jgi:hypothetical protein
METVKDGQVLVVELVRLDVVGGVRAVLGNERGDRLQASRAGVFDVVL